MYNNLEKYVDIFLLRISNGTKALLIFVIELYQRTLSPDHGWVRYFYPSGMCRYYPSCSEYTKESIKEWGVTKGIFAGVARVCRCHPWAASGFDPVIKKEGK